MHSRGLARPPSIVDCVSRRNSLFKLYFGHGCASCVSWLALVIVCCLSSSLSKHGDINVDYDRTCVGMFVPSAGTILNIPLARTLLPCAQSAFTNHVLSAVHDQPLLNHHHPLCRLHILLECGRVVGCESEVRRDL
jgi:hypothetical protein